MTDKAIKKIVDNPYVNNPAVRQGLYQTGRQEREKDDGRPLSSDGRPMRAAGGRIRSVSHEDIADRLVAQAERAKKMLGKSTEPLLNTPDDMIAKALEVAGKGI